MSTKAIRNNLNRATREVKEMLKNEKNQSNQEYLKDLKATDYNFWKAISTEEDTRPCAANQKKCSFMGKN